MYCTMGHSIAPKHCSLLPLPYRRTFRLLWFLHQQRVQQVPKTLHHSDEFVEYCSSPSGKETFQDRAAQEP